MERNIKTTYFDHRKNELRTNNSVHVSTAVVRAVMHMQCDDYSARVCEVYDNKILYAVILRRVNREILVLYNRGLSDAVYKRG
jgi:hypothetical protein